MRAINAYTFCYSLWYVPFSDVLSIFCQSVHAILQLLRVLVNFIIQSVRFWKISNEIILQSTSEARIMFPDDMFSTLIIRIELIIGWFIMSLILSLLLKAFFSCVWISTVTTPWLIKMLSLYFLLGYPNSNNQFARQIYN